MNSFQINRWIKFFFISFLALPLVHCSKKLDLQCGCIDTGRRQYIVQVRVGERVGDFLDEIDYLTNSQHAAQEIEIYGMCFEKTTNTVFFCAESRSDYKDLENNFQDLRFDEEEF